MSDNWMSKLPPMFPWAAERVVTGDHDGTIYVEDRAAEMIRDEFTVTISQTRLFGRDLTPIRHASLRDNDQFIDVRSDIDGCTLSCYVGDVRRLVAVLTEVLAEFDAAATHEVDAFDTAQLVKSIAANAEGDPEHAGDVVTLPDGSTRRVAELTLYDLERLHIEHEHQERLATVDADESAARRRMKYKPVQTRSTGDGRSIRRRRDVTAHLESLDG